MKQAYLSNDILNDRGRRSLQLRLGRELSREEARQIAANVTGFFAVLAEWSRAEVPHPADVMGNPAASGNEEARHER